MQRAGAAGGEPGRDLGGQTRRPQRTGGSPRKGEGRANIRGRSVAGRGPKRFKDVLREQVLDTMCQDEDDEREEEGQEG